MSSPEITDANFDILLFEDEAEQSTQLESGPGSPPKPAVVKREENEGGDSEGEREDVADPERREYAINCIEEWSLENLLEMSTDKPSWAFNIASRRKPGKQATGMAKRRLLWPRKGVGTMRTMAQANKVAEMSHQALRDNVPITKRDIFYGDVPLFGKQSVVDTLVDDLAATWGLRRADLNIRAALKGVFVGSCLTLHLSHGETVHGLDHEETLIPVGEDIVRTHVDERCRWVLIVEKEAVFQTLVQLNFASKYKDMGPGIIITGKGYPDLATRQLVAAFSAGLPDDIPILALVDGDPHGLEILATYIFGSRAMAHENDQLVAPRVQWIGVTIEDLETLGIALSKMIELTWRDRRKAATMLEAATLPKEWIAELERMVDIGFKAEIEVVSATRATGPHMLGGSRALDSYLHDKIATVLAGLQACVKQEVKSEAEVFVKFESSPSPAPGLSVTSPEPEPRGSPPPPSQQSASEYVKQEMSDVEQLDLDFEDDFLFH